MFIRFTMPKAVKIAKNNSFKNVIKVKPDGYKVSLP